MTFQKSSLATFFALFKKTKRLATSLSPEQYDHVNIARRESYEQLIRQQIRFEKEKSDWIIEQNTMETQTLREKVKCLELELYFSHLEAVEQLDEAISDMNIYKADCLETYLQREALVEIHIYKQPESEDEIIEANLRLQNVSYFLYGIDIYENTQILITTGLQEANSQIAILEECSNDSKIKELNQKIANASDSPKSTKVFFKNEVQVFSTYSPDDYQDRKLQINYPIALEPIQYYCMLADKRQMGTIVPGSPEDLEIDAFEAANFESCPLSQNQMQQMLSNLRGMCSLDGLVESAQNYLSDMEAWVSSHCKNTTDFDFTEYESSMEDIEGESKAQSMIGLAATKKRVKMVTLKDLVGTEKSTVFDNPTTGLGPRRRGRH
ncbi:hypothetical protein HDU79_012062 [Rhizoclosmatium sp. JEL0117]|nr:hypothetical protein HDU79_012062 [Rhizoclosmatium sp. JEL0117]